MKIARTIHSLLTTRERRRGLGLFFLMLAGMGLETLGISLVIPAIVLLIQSDLSVQYPQLQPILDAIGNPSQAQLVWGGMMGLLAIYILKTSFLVYLVWTQTKYVYAVQSELSHRLFKRYMGQPYAFHLLRNSAQLIRNVITEVGQFTTVLNSFIRLLTEGLVMIGLTVLLFLVEPLGALIVISVFGASTLVYYRGTRNKLSKWGLERQHHEGLRIQYLQQGLGGIKDAILLGREREFLDQYDTPNIQSARAGRFHTTLQQFPRLLLELLVICGLVILVLAMLVQERDIAVILPTLGLFTAAAFRLMPSVTRILGAAQAIRYGLPVIEILKEEFALTSFESSERSEGVITFESRLTLTDVDFVYSNSSLPAVSGVSLSIKKGESVGFIGSSGSGKSTLIDIILGLLEPSHGQVFTDGKNILDNIRGWQNLIGYVPQSIFLTDESLRRNVAFGLPNSQIDDKAVDQAIVAAQLEDFVTTLPNGKDTTIGERGVRLSGGQRQRIGIARALYHDPEILVLDEATSALDTDTEVEVMQAIRELQRSKTILIVAHRLTTVEHCDRIYRLDEGRIVSEGSPADILESISVAG